ncbi:MAG: serine/threonine-protein kinase [Terracidiphilus sp.]|jgi:serine/threonine-protein kinase
MTVQIGQYRILEELGAGGMGIVYRALDTQLQREVALKRLRSEFAASPAVLERFRNEAKLQGRMNHPNIAQLYSLVQTQDAFCIVMELVTGVMVKDLIPLQWELAVTVIGETLDALGYAHNLGVLHRDIKPENILIDQRGTVKVMDFGIAYAVGSQRMTREKSIVGTLEYMSPERILGKPMDGRSDIYALGIVLFELLSGRLPFDISNEFDLLRWHLEEEPPSITSVADVPLFFDAVIRKAMAKDPAQRYATCSEMNAHMRDMAPSLDQNAGALQAQVAEHLRSFRSAVFDEHRCYLQVMNQIFNGELNAAERVLRDELNRHPRAEPLRQYHEVVLRGQSQSGLTDCVVEEREIIQSWLRLIAADRAADRDAYQGELERMQRSFPNSALVELLRVQAYASDRVV